jgi:hypothetical protein
VAALRVFAAVVRWHRASPQASTRQAYLRLQHHTDAIRQAAPEYERRVVAFFDEALRR